MNARLGIALAERGMVPTPLLRREIQRLCTRALTQARRGSVEAFLREMAVSPVALVPEEANAQHYEVASEFFQLVLGRQLKYSSAFWPSSVETLDDAESAMLQLTCERAGLRDGQDVLELGCGWGSLSLYMARRYPRSSILAVSNSVTQRQYIEKRRPPNLRIITADMNSYDPGCRFDRIVSVEMFEHMRNWPAVLDRVAEWLRDEGRLFIHVFCHALEAYTFDTGSEDDWMGRYFFSGGIMPSHDLLPRAAAGRMSVEEQWWLDGNHYRSTAAAWRENLEARRPDVMTVLRGHYGEDAGTWYHRWRLFFLACEELFGYRSGTEWGVGHYRLAKREVVS